MLSFLFIKYKEGNLEQNTSVLLANRVPRGNCATVGQRQTKRKGGRHVKAVKERKSKSVKVRVGTDW